MTNFWREYCKFRASCAESQKDAREQALWLSRALRDEEEVLEGFGRKIGPDAEKAARLKFESWVLHNFPSASPAEEGVPAPPVHDHGPHRPTWFQEMLACLSHGEHVLLCGPAGSGKTTLARQAANDLGRPFFSLSTTDGIEEADLCGRWIPKPAGGFRWINGVATKAAKAGGIFLADEFDSAPARVALKINALLANGFLSLDGRGGQEIQAEEGFACIAACNTWGNGSTGGYQRSRLDAATLDRFHPIQVDYDARYEESMISPEILAFGREIRRRIASVPGLAKFVSTRVLLRISSQAKRGGLLPGKAFEAFFRPWDPRDLSACKITMTSGGVRL